MKRDAQWDEPPGEILSPPTFKSISDIVLGSLRFEIPLLVRGCTHSCCPVIRFYWGGYLVWIAIWQYNYNATLKRYQSTLHKYQSCIILLWTPTRKKSYPFFWNAFHNVVCILKYSAHPSFMTENLSQIYKFTVAPKDHLQPHSNVHRIRWIPGYLQFIVASCGLGVLSIWILIKLIGF